MEEKATLSKAMEAIIDTVVLHIELDVVAGSELCERCRKKVQKSFKKSGEEIKEKILKRFNTFLTTNLVTKQEVNYGENRKR